MRKPDLQNDPARRCFGSTTAEADSRRTSGGRAGDSRRITLTGIAALIGAALACVATGAAADKPSPDSAEFIEFLEYLGSWEGPEEDWVQFLPVDEAITAESLPDAPEPEAESAGL